MMMREKELIKKIRQLRQIKPDKEWVVLTKKQILGEEIGSGKFSAVLDFLAKIFLRRFNFKFALAGIIFVLFGLFGFSQNSLPGDFLYPVKKITEKSQAIFVSEKEKPEVNLELAEKRLEDLKKVVETNQVKKLAPAIKEFQGSLSEVKGGADPKVVKKVVELRKKTKEIQSKGIVVEEEGLEKVELESLYSVLKNLISDLENRTLNEKQAEVLVQMKELVEQGKYSQALELYLTNQ